MIRRPRGLSERFGERGIRLTEALRSKRPKGSLFLTLTIVFAVGFALAVLSFFLVRFGFEYYIENSYLTEANKETRELSYVNDLQRYIDDNDLASTDPKFFSEWVKRQKYVYLMIYKDDELFYSSDMEIKEEDSTADNEEPPVGEESPPAGEDAEVEDNEQTSPPPSTPGSGITVDMPTYDELKAYAAANGLHPITVDDGVLFASVAEFTEYLYYDLSNIISLIAAMVAFAIVFILFFSRVLSRITRLASDVNRVAGGEMDYSIKAKGNDEISRLSVDVENMRSSIIENLEREREARAANEELITSMSHDIRTPLTVLLGYLDVMKLHPHDELMGEYISATEATALRLKKLSDDMFGYFLVFGNDGESANMQDYDAQTLMSQMLDEHILLLRENGYTVISDGADSLDGLLISTDAPKAMRLIDNVFSNLHKYSDKDAPITLSLTKIDEGVCLRVENGIAPSSETVESNRIGLKTCKKLSKMLGIGFESGEREDKYVSLLTFPTK